MSRTVLTTPAGPIGVTKTSDEAYPGFWISVNDKELILVEYDATIGKNVIRVWDGNSDQEEYIYKQVVEHE